MIPAFEGSDPGAVVTVDAFAGAEPHPSQPVLEDGHDGGLGEAVGQTDVAEVFRSQGQDGEQEQQ
ncbi:MAG: hypothetical protein PUD47_00075 [Bacteroidales bacterium]|nr:hypothetical protein [Bacteroidales bacterium]